jgi:hypothetical protein
VLRLGATQGTVFDLYIDNTAGASTVTIAVAVNGILSTAANDCFSVWSSTVAAGATGVARFTSCFPAQLHTPLLAPLNRGLRCHQCNMIFGQ